MMLLYRSHLIRPGDRALDNLLQMSALISKLLRILTYDICPSDRYVSLLIVGHQSWCSSLISIQTWWLADTLLIDAIELRLVDVRVPRYWIDSAVLLWKLASAEECLCDQCTVLVVVVCTDNLVCISGFATKSPILGTCSNSRSQRC